MSALGHKRTFPQVQPMSALPPKADILPSAVNVRCHRLARGSGFGRRASLIQRKDALPRPSNTSFECGVARVPSAISFGHGPHSTWLREACPGPPLPEPISLMEATMSHARPMHPQQLPTLELAWLIIAVVFIMLVAVPGALTLLALLLSEFIL
jgi:hypothetical protein